jgi:hypothetical protein
MRRTRTLLFIAAGSLAGMVAGPALAQDATSGAGGSGKATAGAPSGAIAGKLTTASATVEKVNADKHELTLKSSDNKPFTINVPDNVARLDNVKPGDKLRVSFYESVAVSLAKPGEAPVGQQKSIVSTRTPGALPGGAVAKQITTTAKIVKVADSKDELTIAGKSGKETTIKVDDPQVQSQLSKLKVGDRIQTTFTQAMATSVTPARAM